MTKTAPQERIVTSLKELYRLPHEPLALTSKSALRAFLSLRDIDCAEWIERLWSKVEQGEARVAFDEDVVRYIRTAAARITRHRRYQGADPRARELKISSEVLVEFAVRPNGRIALRKHQNSLSEQMFWWERRPVQALLRGIEEELGIKVAKRFRRSPHLIVVRKGVEYWKDLPSGLESELDLHESSKYPGIKTHNQLFNFIWTMPEQYWRNIYIEHQDDGGVLVHIWAPAEAMHQPDLLRCYIDRYLQARILRLSVGTQKLMQIAADDRTAEH